MMGLQDYWIFGQEGQEGYWITGLQDEGITGLLDFWLGGLDRLGRLGGLGGLGGLGRDGGGSTFRRRTKITTDG